METAQGGAGLPNVREALPATIQDAAVLLEGMQAVREKGKTVKLPFKGIKPTKKHKADAGLDLRAKEAAYWGGPFQMRTIDTGTAVDIPEGCVGILAARSSLSKRGLMLANGVGIIDAGYHGTIKVPLVSLRGGCTVSEGERIAQLMVINVKNSKPVKVDAFEESERGEGGFGSTGRD